MSVPEPELTTRSLAFLDWPEVVARLVEEARSARGAEACRALAFTAGPGEARDRIAEVTEMAQLLRAEVTLPGLAFPAIEELLHAAGKGAPLGAEELQQIAVVCEIAEGVRRFFEGRNREQEGELERLWQIAAALDPKEEIAHRVRQTFDASGEIRDSVSPELARVRRERDAMSTRVREEIETLMRSEEFAPVMQDEFFTQRGDRYVLPLKASAKSMGLGIVHDTSRSGETVFVEPTVVVGLNNRLKVAELGIQRETRRILEEITARVAGAAPTLRADLEILTRIDVIAAKARLSARYGGTPPEIVKAPIVELRHARHPLLTLRAIEEGFDVVPNDLFLGEGVRGGPARADRSSDARVLVVTGPNAGGKTVLLKTIGLAALLTRAGMHVPAAEGTRVGFFDPVLADIGDQQSVMGDLSTFSAHLANLAAILDAPGMAAGDPAARATWPLVLVDELMVGTNPEQGAALARAVLEQLADAPGLTVTTTHYDSLKALADTDTRFRNASMEYDLERLVPTFRLRDGVPGRSYALDIARRMGLPKGVLARAKALAGATTIGLEEVIARLESREAGLARETEALETARREVETTAGDQRAATEALAVRERELAIHSREAIEESVRDAREALRAIVREAQRIGSARAAQEARQALEATAKSATASLPEPPPAAGAPAVLQLGATVFVPSLKSDGVLEKLPDGRGRAKVAVGALTFDVQAAELRAPKTPPAPKVIRRRSSGAVTHHAESTEYSVPTQANTVDLRGMRAEEAVNEVESYLDRASLEGRSPIFVLHGYGTGALKKAVREYLARSPYVRHWHPGQKSQGGDGVSVVDL